MRMMPLCLAILTGPIGCAAPSAHLKAVRTGDEAKLEVLLERGEFDVNEVDGEGRSLLMVAIQKSPEDVEIDEVPQVVQVLVDHGLHADHSTVLAHHHGDAAAPGADHDDIVVDQQLDDLQLPNPFRPWRRRDRTALDERPGG